MFLFDCPRYDFFYPKVPFCVPRGDSKRRIEDKERVIIFSLHFMTLGHWHRASLQSVIKSIIANV